ncbi:hypothetical protein CS022_24005 [Veronia nyctiphanis]|uniref:Major facilitator superfamily (MFS) profile domain-containing protein n=1 Tax=Veronia nyctiphanis TaxID=1278244 RepID=A0A4Q0YGK0_9GAMM|nr:MFS transporter [Veronia nyctiphanis]RXJ68804.1 hypothetical protein CS022_24005 [Veronia nyctiphanis]
MKLTIATLFSAIFVATLEFVMMIPVGALIAEETGLGIENAPLLISIYPMFALISALLTAPFSDYFGRKPILIALISGLIISCLLSMLATTPSHILILRAFAGMVAGIIMPNAIAYAGDVSHDSKRASVVTWSLLAIPMASSFGVPFMAWFVEITSWQTGFGFIALLSLLPLGLALGLQPISTGVTQFNARKLYSELFSLWQHTATRWILIIEFLLVLVVYCVVPQLGVWLELNFLMSSIEIGMCFLMAGFGAIFGNLIASHFVRRGARLFPIAFGSGLLMLVTVIATANWLPMAFISTLLFFMMMGDASRYPAVQVMLTEIVPISLRGRLLLMNMIVTNMAMATGGIVSSLLTHQHDQRLVGMELVGYLIVGLSLLIFMALSRLSRRQYYIVSH